MPAPPLGITERAEVIRWIDADTLVVRLGWPVHLRLIGIDGPERGDAEAHEAALDYVNKVCPPGREIIVSIPTAEAKSLGHLWSFERAPAHAWIDDRDEYTLNQLIVEAGYAVEAHL